MRRAADLPGVLVLGGGEMGSAVAHRLARVGMRVFIVDLERPTCIRRAVCFATALAGGSTVVEGVAAARAASVARAVAIARSGRIPVMALADANLQGTRGKNEVAAIARALGARVVVDARMLKRAGVISRRSAPLVVGLGPGHRAGRDVDVIVETNRGHNLGRTIVKGTAQPNTGTPAEIGGRAGERVIRATGDGVFEGRVAIGSMVRKNAILGTIKAVRGEGGRRLRGAAKAAGSRPGREGKLALIFPVRALIPGLLRGLIADGTGVRRGQKIGDIDPRGRSVDPCTISDKGRAVAGGVLEAIMNWWVTQDGRP